jgi:ferredoxin--NADP+ reductase
MRVAIIGSGPAGFYAAAQLLAARGNDVHVDMFDRLATPWGLVRAGVAPDHPKIKSVTRVYEKVAAHPPFRFCGNVEVGLEVSHNDLSAAYHAVLYAVGAATDRRLNIPGEDLPGSHPGDLLNRLVQRASRLHRRASRPLRKTSRRRRQRQRRHRRRANAATSRR